MMICGVLMFDRRLPLARLRRVIGERFLVFRRFRQRPVQDGDRRRTGATIAISTSPRTWCATKLAGPAGDRELQALASKLMATPLAADRPMWQFHLVTHYSGGSALIARIHHCYADGIALVRVMLSMTDASREGRRQCHSTPVQQRSGAADDPFGELVGPLTGAVKSARRIGRDPGREGRRHVARSGRGGGARQARAAR